MGTEGCLAEGSPRSPLLATKMDEFQAAQVARGEVVKETVSCLGSPATVPHHSPSLPSRLSHGVH